VSAARVVDLPYRLPAEELGQRRLADERKAA
jgi:hypothetical protein